MLLKVISLLAFLAVSSVYANWAKSAACSGKVNPYPPLDSAGKLVASVKNGKLFIDNQVTPPMRIVHVYGTAYEMGYAAGQLLKNDLPTFIDQVYTYLDNDIASDLPPDMPQWLIEIIDQVGIPGALDLTYQWTLPYTPKHFEEELIGLADGSGVDIKKLRQVNMIPEFVKAHCSMVGAWGDAIKDGTLYQLRALDWSMNGPFADYPVVMIYHPDEGYNFAHFSYIGVIGALTGYSAANVGICEKVWSKYNGTYFVDGYPFHYLLRDILQFDPDNSAALNRIMNARRTCSIYIGLGDSDTNQFRVVEYSPDILNVFSDVEYPPTDMHPLKKGINYVEKHAPPRDSCLGDTLVENYGQLNAEALIMAASVHQSGDTHAAIYDFSRNYMYVSSASSFTTGDPIVPAYDRQFLRLDLNQMWAEPRPTA